MPDRLVLEFIDEERGAEWTVGSQGVLRVGSNADEGGPENVEGFDVQSLRQRGVVVVKQAALFVRLTQRREIAASGSCAPAREGRAGAHGSKRVVEGARRDVGDRGCELRKLEIGEERQGIAGHDRLGGWVTIVVHDEGLEGADNDPDVGLGCGHLPPGLGLQEIWNGDGGEDGNDGDDDQQLDQREGRPRTPGAAEGKNSAARAASAFAYRSSAHFGVMSPLARISTGSESLAIFPIDPADIRVK